METIKIIIDNANKKIKAIYSSVESIETLDNTFEVIKDQIKEGLTLAAESFFNEEEVKEMKNACMEFSCNCYNNKRDEIVAAKRKAFVLL